MLNKFIEDICNLLKIIPPNISYDTSHFTSPTMMAQLSNNTKTLFIRKTADINPDVIFALCHELRHSYQIAYHYDLYFKNYKTPEKVDIVTYNRQPAEIDANAFAMIILVDMFHLEPQFKGLPREIFTLIKNRSFEIAKELDDI